MKRILSFLDEHLIVIGILAGLTGMITPWILFFMTPFGIILAVTASSLSALLLAFSIYRLEKWEQNEEGKK